MSSSKKNSELTQEEDFWDLDEEELLDDETSEEEKKEEISEDEAENSDEADDEAPSEKEATAENTEKPDSDLPDASSEEPSEPDVESPSKEAADADEPDEETNLPHRFANRLAQFSTLEKASLITVMVVLIAAGAGALNTYFKTRPRTQPSRLRRKFSGEGRSHRNRKRGNLVALSCSRRPQC